MKQTRKKHNAEFKAKVALEAIQGESTISELAAKYQLHPQQINRWKKTLMEEAVKVFAGGETKSGDGSPELVAELYKKIGKLEVERDFLDRALNR